MKHISTFNDKNKTRTSLLFYMVFVLCGIVIGSFLAEKGENTDNMLIYQRLLPGGSAMGAAVGTFISMSVFLGAAFCAGLSVFGLPCGLALLVYRGMGIGASVALMYGIYGKSAVIPVMVTVLPETAAAALIAAVSVREAARNSGAILAFCLNRELRDERQVSFRLYCVRFIVLVIFSFFISAAEGAIVHIYASLCR